MAAVLTNLFLFWPDSVNSTTAKLIATDVKSIWMIMSKGLSGKAVGFTSLLTTGILERPVAVLSVSFARTHIDFQCMRQQRGGVEPGSVLLN